MSHTNLRPNSIGINNKSQKFGIFKGFLIFWRIFVDFWRSLEIFGPKISKNLQKSSKIRQTNPKIFDFLIFHIFVWNFWKFWGFFGRFFSLIGAPLFLTLVSMPFLDDFSFIFHPNMTPEIYQIFEKQDAKMALHVDLVLGLILVRILELLSIARKRIGASGLNYFWVYWL